MARGWESKAVESQREDDAARGRPDPRSREERESAQKRESLERSRRRIVSELESTGSDMRRTALKHALKFLDDELKDS